MELTLQQIAEREASVSEIIVSLAKNEVELLSPLARLYWARRLAEVAIYQADLPGILAVLRSQELRVAHTAARKAIRLIDFMTRGPRPSVASP